MGVLRYMRDKIEVAPFEEASPLCDHDLTQTGPKEHTCSKCGKTFDEVDASAKGATNTNYPAPCQQTPGEMEWGC